MVVSFLSCSCNLKKWLQHRYFPVNFVKFLGTAFLKNTFWIRRQGWLTIWKIYLLLWHLGPFPNCRGGSRATATSKMECFVIIVNGWKPLTIITKHSILGVAAALDPPLNITQYSKAGCSLPMLISQSCYQ